MAIPENVIKQISEKADIGEVISEYTTLKRKGSRYWGLCPFHTEKTPSFSVTPESGLFYCFGCHKGGTVFNFVMEVEHLSFVEAVEFLGKKVGVAVVPQDGEISEIEKKKAAILELYRRVAGSFHYLLLSSSQGAGALEYLRRRGIKDEIIERFQLGYAPPDPYWLVNFLKKKNYSEEFLKTTGLFSANQAGRAFFTQRVVFPIQSPRGDVVAFGGRILEGSGPKYLNSAESEVYRKGSNLYGFFQAKDAIRRMKKVTLVEGYMDVIALHQAGIDYAVAPLGTAFTQEQGKLLKRFAETVVLFFDGDEAGIKAARRTAEICEALEFQVFIAESPPDTDPADLVQEDRVQELKKILEYPINVLDFLLKKSMASHNGDTPEGKELIIRDLITYIGSMVSDVKRDAAMTKLADLLGLEKAAIKGDYTRRRYQSFGNVEPAVSLLPSGGGKIGLTPELVLMISVIDSRESFSFIRSRISLDNLAEEPARELFICMEECFRTGVWNGDAILERIENVALREFVIQKLVSEEFSVNREGIVRDAVARIQKNTLERQRNDVVKEMKKLKAENAQEDRLTELLERKMYLDGELEKLRVMGNE